MSVFPEPFTEEQLRSIQTPVLLLVGERESVFDPRGVIAQAQRCIPQVETHLVPGNGHMIAMEASDVVSATLLHLLASG